MSPREQELSNMLHERELEVAQLKASVTDKVQAGRERLLQMLLTFVSPLLIAYVGYLQMQTNSKLDTANTNRERIETKIDEAKEETKVVAAEARTAAQKADTAAEHVKVGTAEIKTAVAELKTRMGDPAPDSNPQ